MSRKITKADCRGCYNDVYNHGCGGATECWGFSSADMVPLLVIHVDQPPPYNKKDAKLRPTCYKAQRFVSVKPEALDDQGFWKGWS